jgi:hypothetical protein
MYFLRCLGIRRGAPTLLAVYGVVRTISTKHDMNSSYFFVDLLVRFVRVVIDSTMLALGSLVYNLFWVYSS